MVSAPLPEVDERLEVVVPRLRDHDPMLLRPLVVAHDASGHDLHPPDDERQPRRDVIAAAPPEILGDRVPPKCRSQRT